MSAAVWLRDDRIASTVYPAHLRVRSYLEW